MGWGSYDLDETRFQRSSGKGRISYQVILLHDPWSMGCCCAGGRSFPEERSLGFGYLCMWLAFSYDCFLVVFANGTA